MIGFDHHSVLPFVPLRWGIPAGLQVNVTWIQLTRAPKWEAQLPAQVRDSLPPLDRNTGGGLVGGGNWKTDRNSGVTRRRRDLPASAYGGGNRTLERGAVESRIRKRDLLASAFGGGSRSRGRRDRLANALKGGVVRRSAPLRPRVEERGVGVEYTLYPRGESYEAKETTRGSRRDTSRPDRSMGVGPNPGESTKAKEKTRRATRGMHLESRVKPDNRLDGFPQYPLARLQLPAVQAAALHQLSGWVVLQHRELILEAMGGDSFPV